MRIFPSIWKKESHAEIETGKKKKMLQKGEWTIFQLQQVLVKWKKTKSCIVLVHEKLKADGGRRQEGDKAKGRAYIVGYWMEDQIFVVLTTFVFCLVILTAFLFCNIKNNIRVEIHGNSQALRIPVAMIPVW